ncbi:MAG: hypothetical protein CMF25_07565 [Kangiellaceae bacterium]|nr:hypothetical protein [Kangiellaceae bacterium]|tara:strand:- start:2169 stop:2627 length:459 start_codon:yes stop_codon:yes gene_type:complete
MQNLLLTPVQHVIKYTPELALTTPVSILMNKLCDSIEVDWRLFEGKTIELYVIDVNKRLQWHCRNQRFHPCISRQKADARISGNLNTFVVLIQQSVDSDTLFFERKLQMEGNTEVGLAMRNMLDAIDWDEQPPIIAVPKRLFDSALARSLSS